MFSDHTAQLLHGSSALTSGSLWWLNDSAAFTSGQNKNQVFSSSVLRGRVHTSTPLIAPHRSREHRLAHNLLRNKREERLICLETYLLIKERTINTIKLFSLTIRSLISLSTSLEILGHRLLNNLFSTLPLIYDQYN